MASRHGVRILTNVGPVRVTHLQSHTSGDRSSRRRRSRKRGRLLGFQALRNGGSSDLRDGEGWGGGDAAGLQEGGVSTEPRSAGSSSAGLVRT